MEAAPQDAPSSRDPSPGDSSSAARSSGARSSGAPKFGAPCSGAPSFGPVGAGALGLDAPGPDALGLSVLGPDALGPDALGPDALGAGALGPSTVAAVIPVFEEAGAIGPTLRRLPRDVVGHVLVIDGGSRDGTVAEAEQAGGLVLRELRRGYGRACARGVAAAAERGATIALFLDGDGSDCVEQAARIVGPVLRGEADLVLAWRSAPGRARGSMGRHQVLAGWVIGLACRALTGIRTRDMSAFRAIRIDALERLGMTETTYGWNLDMQLRAAHAGLRVLEIELPYGCRIAGRSKVAGNWRGTIRTSIRLGAVLLRTTRAVLRTRRSGPHAKPGAHRASAQ